MNAAGLLFTKSVRVTAAKLHVGQVESNDTHHYMFQDTQHRQRSPVGRPSRHLEVSISLGMQEPKGKCIQKVRLMMILFALKNRLKSQLVLGKCATGVPWGEAKTKDQPQSDLGIVKGSAPMQRC